MVNIGKENTGRGNTGDSNTGDRNTGDSNTGDSNTGYRNTGAFCTDKNPVVWLFDKPTKIAVRDWENNKVVQIMRDYLNPNIYVWESEMTDKEKEQFPTYKTTGGYLKSISMHEAWANMWGNLTDDNKSVFTSLPNFDKAKFLEITGIKL